MRYRIVNWAEYQHYRDRCPPWIRLHNSLLTSRTWVSGDDASRVLAVASMLLASRDKSGDGTFDGDHEYVKRVCYLNQEPNFKPLVDSGFLMALADASTMLASHPTEQSRAETEQSIEDVSAGAETTATKSGVVEPGADQPQYIQRTEDAEPAKRERRTAWQPPTIEDVKAYCLERKNSVDAEGWYAHYKANGWRVGRAPGMPMKDWKAAVITWEKNRYDKQTPPLPAQQPATARREHW